MPQIQIPSPLRQYAGKQASVNVPAASVGEALKNLVAEHPDLKRHLYADDGKLRAFVNVYVNDEDMRYLQKKPPRSKTVIPFPSFRRLPAAAEPGFAKDDLRIDPSPNAPPRALSPLSVVPPFDLITM